MAQELSQKDEEIRKYHAEQAVVFRQIREQVGQSAEMANKARLYDQLVGSGDPTSARQTIPILVKYLWMMSNLFEDIQRLIPPSETPRRVLYQGPPGSPTGTLYEAMGEVAMVHNPPTAMEPGEGSRPGSSGKTLERTRSSQASGRIPDPIGPEGINHLSARPQNGPGLQIGSECKFDVILPSERRLPEKGSPEHVSLLRLLLFNYHIDLSILTIRYKCYDNQLQRTIYGLQKNPNVCNQHEFG